MNTCNRNIVLTSSKDTVNDWDMDVQHYIKSESQIEESCSLTDSDELSYWPSSEDELFYSDTEEASISESEADGDNDEQDTVESEECNSSTYSVTVSEDSADYSSSGELFYSTCSETSGLEAEANDRSDHTVSSLLERTGGDEIRQQVDLRSDSALCAECQNLWLKQIKHHFMNSF